MVETTTATGRNEMVDNRYEKKFSLTNVLGIHPANRKRAAMNNAWHVARFVREVVRPFASDETKRLVDELCSALWRETMEAPLDSDLDNTAWRQEYADRYERASS